MMSSSTRGSIEQRRADRISKDKPQEEALLNSLLKENMKGQVIRRELI
jgi:hypothetical protein